jgi:hypothetical protein
MKKTAFFSLFILSLLISACITKKVSFTNKDERKEVKNLPFTEKEYKTDKDYFRAVASGVDEDLETAKMGALTTAKINLVQDISSKVETSTTRFVKGNRVGKETESSGTLENYAISSTKESLAFIRVIGEKVFQLADNRYEVWVAIETSSKGVADRAVKGISSSKTLQLESDAEKFRKVFEEEMSKLDN